MPFNPESKRALEISSSAAAAAEEEARVSWRSSKEGYEPRSVLDRRRSPSPPTSTSTVSSSLGGSVAAISENPPRKWPPSQGTTSAGTAEEWASELHPIPPTLDMAVLGSEKCGPGMDDWDSVLSEPNIAVGASSSPGQDQSFLRWIMGDSEESFASGLKHQIQHQVLPPTPLEFPGGDGGVGFGLVDAVFGFDAAPSVSFPFADNNGGRTLPNSNSSNSNLVFSALQPQGMILQEPPMTEKSQLYGSSVVLHQQQAIQAQIPSSFVLPMTGFSNQQPNLHSPNTKRHHSMVDPGFSAFNPANDLFLRRQKQQQSFESLGVLPRAVKAKFPGEETTPEAVVDRLLEAAEMIDSGNFGNAREILARLNHQLSPVGKPLLRSAFYCKEALQSLVSDRSSSSSPSTSSPLDVVLKLSAYKAFSEISPLLQFTNFTCTQALLEELNGCDRIHIIDFDIGIGSQWSSFMQELAQRRCALAPSSPSLKLTAIASFSSFHSFELSLTRENLSHFACELNISLEFNVLSGDSLDPGSLLGVGEAIAVNLPACSVHRRNPNLLRLVKQLSPRIVVCVDHGWDHSDFAFPRHFHHVLQSAAMLLDSIDAACGNPEVVSKIERYVLQPKIRNSIFGRHKDQKASAPLWNVFASPLSFSNVAESQAECLMKRIQIRGFHVEKRQSSLLLCWRGGELASVSAWRC